MEEKKGVEFKLVPLVIKGNDGKIVPNGTAILQNWHYFTNGLERVLSFSTGDSSYEKVLNEVLGGALTLWIGFQNGKYVGFCTTRHDSYLLSDNFITIVHLFIRPEADKEIFNMGFDYIKEKLCVPNKAKLRFFSPRNGWTKKLIGKGWTIGYTEFICNEEV